MFCDAASVDRRDRLCLLKTWLSEQHSAQVTVAVWQPSAIRYSVVWLLKVTQRSGNSGRHSWRNTSVLGETHGLTGRARSLAVEGLCRAHPPRGPGRPDGQDAGQHKGSGYDE